MTKLNCPFCKTEVEKHPAVDCLDHWIEAVRKGYADVCIVESGGLHGWPYFARKEFDPMGKGLLGDGECKAQFIAKRYSMDMNAAMTLWRPHWRVFRLIKNRIDGWCVEDSYVSPDFKTGGYAQIAFAKNLALAIC